MRRRYVYPYGRSNRSGLEGDHSGVKSLLGACRRSLGALYGLVSGYFLAGSARRLPWRRALDRCRNPCRLSCYGLLAGVLPVHRQIREFRLALRLYRLLA